MGSVELYSQGKLIYERGRQKHEDPTLAIGVRAVRTVRGCQYLSDKGDCSLYELYGLTEEEFKIVERE
jgi:hypothetical protein